MHRRDLIKKKAISSNDHDTWEQFKCARNQAKNAIKHAKKRYFSDNLVADLKLTVTSELNNLTFWLRANRLSLNVAKTELMIIGSRQRLNALPI